jgi:hypothetical protein
MAAAVQWPVRRPGGRFDGPAQLYRKLPAQPGHRVISAARPASARHWPTSAARCSAAAQAASIPGFGARVGHRRDSLAPGRTGKAGSWS